MIRNVVFDMGQVLLRWEPWVYIKRLGLSAEDEQIIFQEVFNQAEWVMMDRGSLNDEQAWRLICRRLPERLHQAAAECVLGWWKPEVPKIPGMLDVIKDLKAAGYKCYVLSNASHRFPEYFSQSGYPEYFDGIIYSAPEKILKPEREAFSNFCERFSLKAEECVFLDDTPCNIEAAINFGMKGIVFKGDCLRLRRELQELGVEIN